MTKKIISILFILLCYCHSNKTKETQFSDKKSVLDFYSNYSYYTDPGKYAYLYKNLPDSLTELCKLIKCQFIHPVDLEPYRDMIPPHRHYEDPKFPTAEKLLAGLLRLNSNGLTFNRKPENRLVVTCRYHAIFLASILKYRGIPVRVRYGFAPYLAPNTDLHICHVICEVWNAQGKRWMFVDPDRKMVDIPKNEFELSGDVWLQYQNGEITHPEKYGVAETWGAYNILDMLCHDFASVLGQERLYWEHPPLSKNASSDIGKLEKEKKELLNQISLLLKNPDDHLNEIKDIYEKYDFLQYR
jgi:hypothetical protein